MRNTRASGPHLLHPRARRSMRVSCFHGVSSAHDLSTWIPSERLWASIQFPGILTRFRSNSRSVRRASRRALLRTGKEEEAEAEAEEEEEGR